MPWNLILSGGPGHDFNATSEALAEVVKDVGVESEITEDIAGALTERPEVDLITINAMRWRMRGNRFPWPRDPFELPAEARAALLAHLDGGGGILAMHAAPICFDDWKGWGRIIGATWNWERSFHPPLGWVTVHVRTGSHPIVEDVRDFDVCDEVYSALDCRDALDPLAIAENEQPLVWARNVRRGHVVYDGLGHDIRSYDSPAHRALLQRAALWAIGEKPP